MRIDAAGGLNIEVLIHIGSQSMNRLTIHIKINVCLCVRVDPFGITDMFKKKRPRKNEKNTRTL